MSTIFKTIITIALLSFISCNGKKGKSITEIFSGSYVDREAFATIAKTKLPAPDTTDSLYQFKSLTEIPFNVARAYALNNYEPFWISGKGITQAAEQLPSQLESLSSEGIHVSDHTIKGIKEIVEQLKSRKEFSADTLFSWDEKLTNAYITAAHQLLMGEDFSATDSQWFVENDSAFFAPEYITAHFKEKEDFPSFDTFRSELPEYKLAMKEVKFWELLANDKDYLNLKKSIGATINDSMLQHLVSYECKDADISMTDTLHGASALIHRLQKFYGLRATNKIDEVTLAQLKRAPQEYLDQLQVNLKRLRALPRTLSNEYVFVSIPLMELNYVKDKNVKFNSRVIVGALNHPTPSISSPMTNIVFNPPWGVPISILKNEIGPGIARRGSGYLRRKGLRAYDSRGRDVTGQVTAGNIRKYAVRQPPGARNALGEIKFNMPNKESIYIHDTPNRSLFGNYNRALSHGCVRTDNPKLFAATVLGTDKFPQFIIDSIINKRQTKSEELVRKIPVFITYLTITPDNGGKRLRYLQDIYKRDQKMKNEIAKSAVVL